MDYESNRQCAPRALASSAMTGKGLHRQVGPMALMFTGLGSIIGSGWLFGAWRGAHSRVPAPCMPGSSARS